MSRDLRLVGISLLIWGLGEATWYFFEPLYLQQLGADPFQIGLIIGLSGLAFTLTHLPAGYIADRFGRRSILVAGWLTGIVSSVIMYLANSLAVFTVGIVFYSFTGFVISPLNSYVTNARNGWSVARALTTIGAMYSLGAIFGPPIGGWIAERFELRSVYGLASIIFTVSTAILLFTGHQPVEKREPGGTFRDAFAHTAIGRFLTLAFISLFAMYFSWPLTPNFLQNERAVSVTQIGLFGALNSAGLVVLNLVLGRFNARRAFLYAQVFVAASVFLIWQGAGPPWFAAGYLFAGAYRTGHSMLLAQAEGLVRPADLGLVYGAIETISGAVIMLAAPIAGLLYAVQPSLPFPLGLLMILLSLMLTPWLAPRLVPQLPGSPIPVGLGELRRE